MTRRTEIAINSTASLPALLAAASAPQRELMNAMLAHYVDEFERIDRLPETDAISVAYSVHQLVDERIADVLANDPLASAVTCRRGCGHCCHLQVSIDRTEAALLLAFASEQGIEIDHEHLRRQADYATKGWRAMPRADQRCVFLSAQDECQVYEHRPNACRKYHVISDPDLCNTEKHPDHEVGMLVSGQAEIVASAALVAFAPARSMPLMLLAATAARQP